jgi:hypothetical protein
MILSMRLFSCCIDFLFGTVEKEVKKALGKRRRRVAGGRQRPPATRRHGSGTGGVWPQHF